ESTNWRDYREGPREGYRVYKWVWIDLFRAKTRQAVKRTTVYIFLGNVLALFAPWFFGKMLNALIQLDAWRVLVWFSAFAVLVLSRVVLKYLEARIREIALGTSVGDVDDRTNQLFMEKSLGQHLHQHHRLSSHNVERGRANVNNIFKLLMCEGVESVTMLAFMFISIWFVSVLAGICMVFLLAIYLIWSWHMNQRCAKICVPLEAEFRALNRYRGERWELVERVMTSGMEAQEVLSMSNEFDRLIIPDCRFWHWFIKQANSRHFVNNVIMLGVLGIALWRILHGQVAIGVLYPLFAWMSAIVDNIWRIGYIEHQLSWNLPSIRSMKEALTMAPDVCEKPNATTIGTFEPIRVEFKNISHAYKPTEAEYQEGIVPRPVLQNVSFTIEPGESVALIAKSGGGKTTLLRLLQRNMDPDRGTILVNGHDLRDLKLSAWHHAIGYIPQQAMIFNHTLRYNLLYKLTAKERACVSDKELWALMRELQIDFGDRLTKGLDTVVGKNGLQLSGGQAQRVMIGAAVLNRPRLVLIDEATSSLDPSTERAVQAGLAQILSRKMSVLVVTHRLSTIRHCDKFVVLGPADRLNPDESQIEAIASSFEELIRISPTFRQLCEDGDIKVDSSLVA
ncbi:MAG TPA: ABC transporter ATP-binding protein, partial [Patescibacteria group bacterium]|nr:ABC transporter ATP-binding protein [Patescibacteria group bacterium]